MYRNNGTFRFSVKGKIPVIANPDFYCWNFLKLVIKKTCSQYLAFNKFLIMLGIYQALRSRQIFEILNTLECSLNKKKIVFIWFSCSRHQKKKKICKVSWIFIKRALMKRLLNKGLKVKRFFFLNLGYSDWNFI